jgi:hypothetical protein
VRSSGDLAVALYNAAAAGLPEPKALDPWQQALVVDALGETEDGWYAATEAAVFAPRQNGKGDPWEAIALWGVFVEQIELQVWSAHQVRTALRAMQRIEALIRAVPELFELVGEKGFRRTNGQEAITTVDGCELQFNSRSERALRGFTGKRLFLDEAQELTGGQMAAISLTKRAKSMSFPGAQILYSGTPPLTADAWCYALRHRGDSKSARFVMHDFGLDLRPIREQGQHSWDTVEFDPKQVGDRENWAASNPALGVRVSEDEMVDELERLGESLFARECLGVWLPRKLKTRSGLSIELWGDCHLEPPLPVPDEVAPRALALAAYGGRWFIARAWPLPGPRVDRLVDELPEDVAAADVTIAVDVLEDGLDVVEGARRLRILAEEKRATSVVLLQYTEAGQVAPDLEDVFGFRAVKSTEWPDAWTRFVTDVEAVRVAHPGDHMLDRAVHGSVAVKVRSRMVLDVSRSSAEGALLQAAALAHWEIRTTQPPAASLSDTYA